ncbi:hypothetical protein BD770DRAFT_407681 [Pilaira anomala]|nr:hypothetical protein BD770DRAFT_407681 [Pilaira anomala]
MVLWRNRGIVNESGEEVSAYLVGPSFRLKKLTDLQKYIKNKKVLSETKALKDIDTEEAPAKKERATGYNQYSNEDRLRYFYFLHETIPKSNLNDQHKAHLINFFDDDPSAVIQDAVENLVKSFEGLEIKKSGVAELIKEECNLSIKVVTRHLQLKSERITYCFLKNLFRISCKPFVIIVAFATCFCFYRVSLLL